MTEAVIGEIVCERIGSSNRVISLFDGEPAIFETEDIELEPSVEAFGTLWLIPCILAKRNLRFEKPVCKTWYENAHKLIDFLSDRWGTAKIKILAETYESKGDRLQAQAVCFSGGVDSMYTLMTTGSPKYLLRGETFNPASQQTKHFQLARKRLTRVADAVGAIPITIKYNLLEHPSHNLHDMNDVYTGILAGMGHLLSQHIGSIAISSTHHEDEPTVYTCRYRTDPLYSAARLQVHHDASVARRQKVAAIAEWHIAQENLFVCFNRQGLDFNCSQCEKCVRTMLDLHILGKLESFKRFDQSKPLWEAMDQVKAVTNLESYRAALAEPLEPRIANGIWRMLRREYERAQGLEVANQHRRRVDDEFIKMREGLNNALNHYSQLQEEHQRLADDYAAIAGNLPIRNGIKLIRKVARKLRAPGTRQGARYD